MSALTPKCLLSARIDIEMNETDETINELLFDWLVWILFDNSFGICILSRGDGLHVLME